MRKRALLHVAAHLAALTARIPQTAATVAVSALLAGCAEGQTMNGLKVGDFFADPNVRALADAAARGDTAAVHRARTAGADVNAAGKEGMTPLLWAMSARNLPGVQALLDAGADPNGQGPKGLHPLTLAAGAPDTKLLQLLLDHGGNASAKDGEGDPLLYTAVMQRQWENMKLLVARGADVNAVDAGHSTPAMLAAGVGEWEAVAYLLEHGADPTIPRLSGGTVAYALERSRIQPDQPQGAALARVRQLLVARGVSFPAPNPQEVRKRVFGVGGTP